MLNLEVLHVSIPEWSGKSSPFSKGENPTLYRPEDLKDSAEGDTPRTRFFEEVLTALYWKLDRAVPFAFKTENGEVRSLDAGCLKFLRNRRNPEIDFVCDSGGYIVAVQPLPKLVARYKPLQERLLEQVSRDQNRAYLRQNTEIVTSTVPLAQIETALLRRGFRKSPGLKVCRMDHGKLSTPIYLKTPKANREKVRRPVVIHPELSEITQNISGLLVDGNFYHNSNLRSFPTRLHTGQTPTNYGIDIDFENTQALDDFLDFLIEIEGVGSDVLDNIKSAEADFEGLDETERNTLVRARLGQGQFRWRLIRYWKGCAVTGIQMTSMLRASHIKPWRNSSNFERLDEFNGLLLTPNLDCAFDGGLISFDDEGYILISTLVDGASVDALGIKAGLSLRSIEDRHRTYLRWHRDHVFGTNESQNKLAG